MPLPVPEHRFHPTRRWRLDWAWPDPAHPCWMIAVEVEGGAWTRGRHTRGAGYVADMQKYNTATLMGWRVLRYTPQQFARGDWVADVARLIGGAS